MSIPRVPTASTEKSVVYATPALAQIPCLLSLLDREPASASYGSWDREHWGWKFRDFPLGMPQTCIYPLALLWKYPFPGYTYLGSAQVREWILGSIAHTLSRQHSNGAFDGFCPNEQDFEVTLGIAHGLTEAARLLGEEIPAPLRARLCSALRKAMEFGWARDAAHAFISNHWALFALAYLNAQDFLGEPRYGARAAEIIDRIARAQSPDGWYPEYGGPDPGYESLGISYLALYWRRTRSHALLDSLRRSVEFYSHCVHPDGSVGGVYGSRHTQQYYPAGFEILSSEIPLAASVARFLRQRLGRGNVVTPASTDGENLPVLLASYLEAYLADEAPWTATPSLPCENLDGVRHFAACGITVAGSPRYYAVVSAAKGGVCRVFDKRDATVAYEDAGYLVRAGRRLWTSQRLQPGEQWEPTAPDEARAQAPFTAVLQVLPTPGKFVLLRLANLTAFRSVRLGAWLRKKIVAHLMARSSAGPLRLMRRIRFQPEEVSFSDRLELEGRLGIESVELVRSFTAIHMGSAKYFHPSELEATPLPDTRGLARELESRRAATCGFRLRFTAAKKPELLSGEAPARREEKQPEGTLTR